MERIGLAKANGFQGLSSITWYVDAPIAAVRPRSNYRGGNCLGQRLAAHAAGSCSGHRRTFRSSSDGRPNIAPYWAYRRRSGCRLVATAVASNYRNTQPRWWCRNREAWPRLAEGGIEHDVFHRVEWGDKLPTMTAASADGCQTA